MGDLSTDAQLIISTDGHAGADVWDYKPYLEKRYHEEFDAWAKAYSDPWGQLTGPSRNSENLGHGSFDIPFNWDSAARLALMDDLGVAAELLFPNTAPPFFPSGMISTPPPLTAGEYEYRFAGIKAHNRWMADFCNDVPGRRAGLAQVFLNDLEDAVAEIRWAREAGLMGVLVPSDHLLMLVNLYEPKLDRLWATCQELDLPVHRHQTFAGQTMQDGGPAAPWIAMMEMRFYAKRAIAHVICSGVFERFPRLKFVSTELEDTLELRPLLDKLDDTYAIGRASYDQASRGGIIGPGAKKLSRKPSEYFASNCYVAAPLDIKDSIREGTPNLMFGADVPHSEGPGKNTRKAVRATVELLREQEVDPFLYQRAAHVYGFDVKALQSVADKFGFTRAEVRTPLDLDDYPSYPDQSRCLIFKRPDQVRV